MYYGSKFAEKLGKDRLAEIIGRLVVSSGDELISVEVDGDGGDDAFDVRVRFRTVLDGEDEPTELEDFYVVNDYDIEVYDWAGGADKLVSAYRKEMYREYGVAYAYVYLTVDYRYAGFPAG